MANETKINKNLFGKRLKSLMDQNGENTHSLGKHLDLSPPTISRYTHGEMIPKMTTVLQIAAYFDVNPEWLMGLPVNIYASEIIDSDAGDNGLTVLSVFRHIAYNKPLFANERVGTVQMPTEKLITWGAVIAVAIDDDSMSPTLLPGDRAIIRLDRTLTHGDLLAVYPEQNDLVIRKVVQPNEKVLILQPSNPKYDAELCHNTPKSFQVIGEVMAVIRCQVSYVHE